MLPHCQENKEKKVEKQKKKALKAAYKADPDGFKQEPSELHSDIDREEEYIIVTCHPSCSYSKSKVLTFSAGKIPPVLHNASATRKATTTDSDSQPEDPATDDKDNKEIAEDLSPIVRGSKHPLDMTLDDAMLLPKMKKNSDGSHHCMKASDFDDMSKEILMTAISLFQCLLVTQAPFPDNVTIKMKLAKVAWHEACQIKGINVKLTPAGIKMLLTCTSQVCRELKSKMHSLMASFFGFCTSNSNTVIRQNWDLAENLKDGSVFAFKDWAMKSGIYKMELLQLSINVMWFADQHDEGVIHHKYFNPMPIKVIALVLTTIECCIDEWLQGLKEDVKFMLATYGPVYHGHFSSLQCFNKYMAPYKLLKKICVNLHNMAQYIDSVDTLSTISSSASWISDMAFKDTI
ncbi:hypothetical protein EDD22DRAFT_958240 [Suillus occidentalis]|nr:hypothetical protein EDD22DRAFT_958240 [Suillus occidentalis]